MAQRLKLTIAYDGRPFAGWQSQAHRNSIQDYIERALKRITGESIRVHGAGRTDAGVHALAQCAHIDVRNRTLSLQRWMTALNALLPPTIRIVRCQAVPKNFHARFSAKGKIYRYRIWTAPVLPPLEYGRAWHVSMPLDVEIMKSVAALFVGTHDFSGFAANRAKPVADTVRTIQRANVNRSGACLSFNVEGDGFLYKMVRLMVGSLVRCASGKTGVEEMVDRLNRGKCDAARLVAPAEGLFLIRIRY